MRYLIDERGIDLEESLSLYRVTLTWAARRGDRFVINLQKQIYDEPDDLVRLCALGQVDVSPQPDLTDFFSRFITSFFSQPGEILQITGTPNDQFIQELTNKSAPRRAKSGDLSPVEDIVVLVGDRPLYALYEYGRTQVLDLTSEELKRLRQTLTQSDLPSHLIVPAPAYVI